MRLLNIIALSGVDTSSQTGSAIDANQLINMSFVPTCGDATAAGTVKIQASNDPVSAALRANFVPTNWADITGATSTIASGAGPAIVLANNAFSFVRVVFTRTGGGSSTISVAMNAVGI